MTTRWIVLPRVSASLALHGAFGRWDELVRLVAGVLLAIAVVYFTQRKQQDDEDDLAPPNETRQP